MPKTVIANVTDGTTKEVPVTWDPATIDTSTAGEKTTIGTVEGFDKTVTFEVIVEMEKDNVTFDLLAKFTNEKLVNPTIKIKNTGTNETKDVTGISHKLNPGAYEYEITILGYEDKSGNFTVTDESMVVVKEEYAPSVIVTHDKQKNGNYNWTVSDPENLGIEKQGSTYPAYQLKFKSNNGTTIPHKYNTVFGKPVVNLDKMYYAPDKVSQLDVLVYFGFNDLKGTLVNVNFPK